MTGGNLLGAIIIITILIVSGIRSVLLKVAELGPFFTFYSLNSGKLSNIKTGRIYISIFDDFPMISLKMSSLRPLVAVSVVIP